MALEELNRVLQGGGTIKPAGGGDEFLASLASTLASKNQRIASSAGSIGEGLLQGLRFATQKKQAEAENARAQESAQQKAEETARKRLVDLAKGAIAQSGAEALRSMDQNRAAVKGMLPESISQGLLAQMGPEMDELALTSHSLETLLGPAGKALQAASGEEYSKVLKDVIGQRTGALERLRKEQERNAEADIAAEIQKAEQAKSEQEMQARYQAAQQKAADAGKLAQMEAVNTAMRKSLEDFAVKSPGTFAETLRTSGDPIQAAIAEELPRLSGYATPMDRRRLLQAAQSLPEQNRHANLAQGRVADIVDQIYGQRQTIYPFAAPSGSTPSQAAAWGTDQWVEFGRKAFATSGGPATSRTFDLNGQQFHVYIQPEYLDRAALGLGGRSREETVALWSDYIRNFLSGELLPSREGKLSFTKGGDTIELGIGGEEKGINEETRKHMRELASRVNVQYRDRTGALRDRSLEEMIDHRKEELPSIYQVREERANAENAPGVWKSMTVDQARRTIEDISRSVRAANVPMFAASDAVRKKLLDAGANQDEVTQGMEAILPDLDRLWDRFGDRRLFPNVSQGSAADRLAEWPSAVASSLDQLEAFQTIVGQIQRRRSEETRRTELSPSEKNIQGLKDQFDREAKRLNDIINGDKFINDSFDFAKPQTAPTPPSAPDASGYEKYYSLPHAGPPSVSPQPSYDTTGKSLILKQQKKEPKKPVLLQKMEAIQRAKEKLRAKEIAKSRKDTVDRSGKSIIFKKK